MYKTGSITCFSPGETITSIEGYLIKFDLPDPGVHYLIPILMQYAHTWNSLNELYITMHKVDDLA